MARNQDRQKATELRQLGKTYGEIRSELGLAKSTLSDWLRDFPLTENQLVLLRKNQDKRSYVAREKTSITKRIKHQKRLDLYYKEQKKKWLPLSKRELFLAGLFLYWGEGGKSGKGTLSISNTDPGVLKFSLLWMRRALNIPKEKIQVLLHIYSDMDIEETTNYWSKTLNIPTSQFAKPYIKKSTRNALSYKGFGHGTCMLKVFSTEIIEKVLMGIKAMADIPDIMDL